MRAMVRADAPAVSTRSVLDWSARTLATGMTAGGAAGVLVGGLGSRLAMRVMAMTTPEAGGRVTDFGARIGEITFGGTLFLFIAGFYLGVVGGMAYLAMRSRLPGRGWRQGLVYGAIFLVVAGGFLVSGTNPDFRILHPAGLAVVMFLALPLLFGLVLPPLVGLVEPRVASFRHPVILGIGALVVLAPTLLFGAVLVLATVVVGGMRQQVDEREARAAGIVALVLVGGLLLVRAWALVTSVTKIL
jgi:hypothetical protein